MKNFWKDMLVLMGILPIIRPRFVVGNKPSEGFRFLHEKDVLQNRRDTEELFKIVSEPESS